MNRDLNVVMEREDSNFGRGCALRRVLSGKLGCKVVRRDCGRLGARS